jgi:hypothetical protein
LATADASAIFGGYAALEVVRGTTGLSLRRWIACLLSPRLAWLREKASLLLRGLKPPLIRAALEALRHPKSEFFRSLLRREDCFPGVLV